MKSRKHKKAKSQYKLTKKDKRDVTIAVIINTIQLLFALADIVMGALNIALFSKNIYVILTCFASGVILLAISIVSFESLIKEVRNLKIKREYEEKRKNND